MIGTVLSFHIPESQVSAPVVDLEAIKRAFESRFEARVMSIENTDWINSASVNQSFTEQEVCVCWCCGLDRFECECTLQKFIKKGCY